MKTKQFTETLIDYIDGKIRRNNLTFKLTLGGGAGPGGGGGLPWNSIIGQLIQKRVAFDVTMSASPCMDPASGYWLQSGSLLDNLNIIRYHQLPATWFETSPTDLRGLSVNVAGGVWYDAENSYFVFSGGTSPTFTLPVTNPRIDVVYITPSGVIEIQQGTEAPSPSITMPTASGVLPTWAVYLPPWASGIGYPCETYSGYLYQDLRPFIAYPPGGGGGNGVGTHTLLQADVHTDTITQVPNQGSIVLGNAAGKWDELTIGAAGTALISDGATAAWGTYMPPVAGIGYAFISDGVDSWTADQNPIWTGMFLFENLALDTTDTCYVIGIDYVKSAGVTNAADNMAGIYSVFQLDQVGGIIGDLYGAYIEAEIANGTTGGANDIWGTYTYVDLNGGTANRDVWGLQAKVYGHGTVVDEDIWGLDGWIDLNTGSVGGDVIGLSSWIDVAAGYTSPGGDVYGLYTYVDVNVAPAGTVYMLYLDEQDGIDYGIYQNGTADNYLGGKLGVGDTTPVTEIHARTAAGMCRIRVEYTATTNLGAFEIYEGAAYKASIHVDGSATAAPNVYLRNCLSIITDTGDIHLKPGGSGNVGIDLSAAPATKLDVGGTIGITPGGATAIVRRTAVFGSTGTRVQGNIHNNINDDTYPGAYIHLGGGPLTDDYSGQVNIVAFGKAATATANIITFSQRTGVDTITERMRIDLLGNVHILNSVGIMTAPVAATALKIVAAGAITGMDLQSAALPLSINTSHATSDRISTYKNWAALAQLTNGGVWTDASSRKWKEEFTDLDLKETLGKIVDLPVQKYKYKHTENERHIGPVAEDFRDAFLIGNGEGLAAIDVAGIGLLGIQALATVVQEQQLQIEQLQRQLRAR